MSIPNELNSVLINTPNTLGGSVRFKGTRVPLRPLLDAISCGRSVEYFLEGYPGVSKEQVMAVIQWEQNQARETFGIALVG